MSVWSGWRCLCLITALVAGGAVMLAYSGGTKLSGEPTSIAQTKRIKPPAPTDLAGDPLPGRRLARLGTTRFLHAAVRPRLLMHPTARRSLRSTEPCTFGTLRQDANAIASRRESGNGIGHVQFAFAPDGRSLAVRAQEVRDEAVSGEGRASRGLD